MKMGRTIDGMEAVSFIKSANKIRKHEWLPCLLSETIDFDSLSEEEYQKLLKKTKWLDNLTSAEYKFLFKPDELNEHYRMVVRSRIKKKITGWLMTLSTLATFKIGLFLEACEEAEKTYEKQTGRPYLFKARKGDGNG